MAYSFINVVFFKPIRKFTRVNKRQAANSVVLQRSKCCSYPAIVQGFFFFLLLYGP